MPLRWSTSHEPDLVLVHGHGKVTRRDIETYLAATIRDGAQGHAKLILLDRCVLVLDPDDLNSVAESMIRYGWGGTAGPVAMVVSDRLNLDMAILLKQRIGARPFSIFVDEQEAEHWLAAFRRPGSAHRSSTGDIRRGTSRKPD